MACVILCIRAHVDMPDRGQFKLLVEEVQAIESFEEGDGVTPADPSAEAPAVATDPGRLDIAMDDSVLGNGGSERLRVILA